MKTRHYTYEELEREDKKLDRAMAISFGILTAICCGITFYMIIDGIINTFIK